MLTYVADVFGHTLVVSSFFICRKIKIQRGFFFCKAGIYSEQISVAGIIENGCLSLSEQSCINLAERYREIQDQYPAP